MKLIDIYRYVISRGIAKDPRSPVEIRSELDKKRREYSKLKGIDRASFDKESLKNPYADTRILFGDPTKEITTIMVGIDMESSEILAADRLNERGASIDLVMAHHPEGGAWASLYDVMSMQAVVLRKFGIPMEVALDQLKERIDEVRRSLSPANHFRSVDMARLFNLPYMCAHTPADNHVQDYLQRIFDSKRPKKVKDVLSLLKAIPEYSEALKRNAGPKILIGSPEKPAGRVFVDMTGGTEGSKKIFSRLSQAGVGTIVAMHISEEHFKNAKDEHINIIVAGHIASDSLGLNLLLDGLGKKTPVRLIPSSGFIRVRR